MNNTFLTLILENDDKQLDKGFLFSLHANLTYLIGGLLYFISWIRTKTKKSIDNIDKRASSKKYEYIYNDQLQKGGLKKFLIFTILTLILLFINFHSIFNRDRNVFEQRLYFIFFIPVFSKIFLGIKVFEHQIFGLILSFVGLILLFIPVIIMKMEKEDISANIVLFFACIGYSFYLVMCRYLSHNYYISPYLVIFILGITSTIGITIGYIFYSLIKCHNLDLIKENFNFDNYKDKNKVILYFILALIFNSGLQALTVLVVYYFNPTLFIVTDILSPILSWIVFCIRKKEEKTINYYLKSFGFFIVFISSLIYNEMVICNFCGLNTNTKKCIEERQKKDIDLSELSHNDSQINDDSSLFEKSENSEVYY